jgi:hypothetical protein
MLNPNSSVDSVDATWGSYNSIRTFKKRAVGILIYIEVHNAVGDFLILVKRPPF